MFNEKCHLLRISSTIEPCELILAFMLNYRHVKNTFLLSTEILSLGVALEFHLKGQKLRFWGFRPQPQPQPASTCAAGLAWLRVEVIQ